MPHRSFIIYFNSTMIACTLAAIVATLLISNAPLNCLPLVLVFIVLMRTQRYCLLWFCGPEHLAIINPDREPLAKVVSSVLTTFITQRQPLASPRGANAEHAEQGGDETDAARAAA